MRWGGVETLAFVAGGIVGFSAYKQAAKPRQTSGAAASECGPFEKIGLLGGGGQLKINESQETMASENYRGHPGCLRCLGGGGGDVFRNGMGKTRKHSSGSIKLHFGPIPYI